MVTAWPTVTVPDDGLVSQTSEAVPTMKDASARFCRANTVPKAAKSSTSATRVRLRQLPVASASFSVKFLYLSSQKTVVFTPEAMGPWPSPGTPGAASPDSPGSALKMVGRYRKPGGFVTSVLLPGLVFRRASLRVGRRAGPGWYLMAVRSQVFLLTGRPRAGPVGGAAVRAAVTGERAGPPLLWQV